jgi:hypothetical protein
MGESWSNGSLKGASVGGTRGREYNRRGEPTREEPSRRREWSRRGVPPVSRASQTRRGIALASVWSASPSGSRLQRHWYVQTRRRLCLVTSGIPGLGVGITWYIPRSVDTWSYTPAPSSKLQVVIKNRHSVRRGHAQACWPRLVELCST